MDCEACTEGMIDLLFDELEDADATRLRTHLSGCEECTDAYARLSLGQAFANQMEMVAPPVGLLDGVLAAAHERAAERAAERAPARSLGSVTVSPPREALPEDEGLWSVMLSWVGGLAMRPQMAMAMTLVLMVGIGLWYLPELRRSDPADSQAIVDPSPVGEVGPSAALAPAEPLDLETDPRTGRIRPRVDEEGPRPTRPRPVRAEPDPTTPEAVATTDDSDSPPSDEALEEPAPPPRIEVAQLDPHVIPPGMGEVNLGEGQALQMAEAPVAPAPPPTGAPQAMMGTRVRGSMNSDDALAMESEEAPSAPTPRPFEEVERPSLQGSTVPTALHRQARNQRAANDCRSAVASYERLFSGHPRYPQSGQARLEAGDCYRRMGRLADARRMFERASRSAQVAAAARRELARLDATENAPVVDIATEAQ